MAGSNEVLLVRHGETEDNAADRFQGRRDTQLNDRGREQSRELAHSLRSDEAGSAEDSDEVLHGHADRRCRPKLQSVASGLHAAGVDRREAEL